MARIIGNLAPEDDYTHPLGPEPNFNESMYFNFFDRAKALGGFVRLGNRANEGNAEMHGLPLPAGRPRAVHVQAPADHEQRRLRRRRHAFEVEEPGQRLRTTYDGRCSSSPIRARWPIPARPFARTRKKRIALDLVHEAVGPVYGHAGSKEERGEAAPRSSSRKAHYEQHMA